MSCGSGRVGGDGDGSGGGNTTSAWVVGVCTDGVQRVAANNVVNIAGCAVGVACGHGGRSGCYDGPLDG